MSQSMSVGVYLSVLVSLSVSLYVCRSIFGCCSLSLHVCCSVSVFASVSSSVVLLCVCRSVSLARSGSPLASVSLSQFSLCKPFNMSVPLSVCDSPSIPYMRLLCASVFVTLFSHCMGAVPWKRGSLSLSKASCDSSTPPFLLIGA